MTVAHVEVKSEGYIQTWIQFKYIVSSELPSGLHAWLRSMVKLKRGSASELIASKHSIILLRKIISTKNHSFLAEIRKHKSNTPADLSSWISSWCEKIQNTTSVIRKCYVICLSSYHVTHSFTTASSLDGLKAYSCIFVTKSKSPFLLPKTLCTEV